MSSRSYILDQMEAVLDGEMSIYDCEDYEEVLDEIGYEDFDSNGYIIKHDYNPYINNNYDNTYSDNNQNTNNQEDKVDNTLEKAVCGCCCLIILYIWIMGLIY